MIHDIKSSAAALALVKAHDFEGMRAMIATLDNALKEMDPGEGERSQEWADYCRLNTQLADRQSLDGMWERLKRLAQDPTVPGMEVFKAARHEARDGSFFPLGSVGFGDRIVTSSVLDFGDHAPTTATVAVMETDDDVPNGRRCVSMEHGLTQGEAIDAFSRACRVERNRLIATIVKRAAEEYMALLEEADNATFDAALCDLYGFVLKRPEYLNGCDAREVSVAMSGILATIGPV